MARARAAAAPLDLGMYFVRDGGRARFGGRAGWVSLRILKRLEQRIRCGVEVKYAKCKKPYRGLLGCSVQGQVNRDAGT